MPIEFIQQSQPAGSSSDTLFRLLMKYDGTGRRISKTVMHKVAGAADWDTAQVTHYTGIGTEIRENYAGPAKQTKVVVKSLQGECRKNKLACSYDRAAAADAGGVNMPQGLGRYGIENAENPDMGSGVGYIPNAKFEWYLKNHLGSTMLVYGTQADANPAHSDIGTPLAAYDYRAFGEMVELTPPSTGKVTENFTGKEHDDEIALDYFGARYLDPMLGMWISVDPARQFSSPYLYAGNGMNPLSHYDANGNYMIRKRAGKYEIRPMSKWSAISGALFRDVPGAIMSVLPNPLIQKLGLAWGVLKSKAQNSYASTTISTIASKGVDKAFVDEINVNGEISYPEYICK
jgi:RHS repeat-associated protein